jgi:hypothetical protein
MYSALMIGGGRALNNYTMQLNTCRGEVGPVPNLSGDPWQDCQCPSLRRPRAAAQLWLQPGPAL